MIQLEKHIKSAFGYFLIAAVLGVVLRSFHSIVIPINYKFIVHTHSHIALLGWVYVALTTLIYKLFVQSPSKDKRYAKIFWFTQLTLVGMLLTFPFQGYALFSIIFSTLFLFASYWFTQFILKNVKKELSASNSFKCIKVALFYMVFSSIGPWALGGIMNTLGADSVWYRMAIYFYLHFQYNGWMVLALLGLFIYIVEIYGIRLSKKMFGYFFWSFNLGILLTFFLSTLWIEPHVFFNILGGVGSVFQIMAILLLGRYFSLRRSQLKEVLSNFQYNLLAAIFVLLVLKMILQLLTALPFLANLASKYIDFTVGYLHWTFLGVISTGLFLFLDFFKLIRISRTAYLFYVVGFIITEVLIFYKGMAAWLNLSVIDGYFTVLVFGSFLIPISLFIILIRSLGNKRN